MSPEKATTPGRVRDKIRDVVEPLIRSEGMDLWEVEYLREGRGTVLRIYVDQAGGPTLDDLSRLSRRLGDVLDVGGVVEGSYTLEVSSPGVNRRLRTLEHFRGYLGKRIRLRLQEPIEGSRLFLGTLTEAVDAWVTIRDDEGRDWTIPMHTIVRANYEHVFSW